MPVRTDLESWHAQALALCPEESSVKIPLWVIAEEAAVASRFVTKYRVSILDPKSHKLLRPGLDLIGNRLPPSTARDLLSLSKALQQAATAYHLVKEKPPNPTKRAKYVLSELRAVLSFHSLSASPRFKATVKKLEALHLKQPRTTEALASSLVLFAGFADLHRRALNGLGGFKTSLIEEAQALAAELQARPRTPQASNPEQKHALVLRNCLASLLLRKIGEVRAAARFVFRDHPEILREASSGYERNKRAASRRKAKGSAENSSQKD